MKAKSLAPSFLLLLLMALPAYSQEAPESMPLWPEGKTPYAQELDEATGRPELFHYPVTKTASTGAAVVICPGGGYRNLAIDHEGNQIARWYNDRGFTAFVLHYRLGGEGNHFPTQLADVQRAIRMVRANAQQWGVDPIRIGVMGFSAGGHLASMAVTKFDEKAYEPSDEIDEASARPDFGVLCYPVISMDPEIGHMGSRKNLLGPDKADDEEAAKHVSSELNVTEETPPIFIFQTGEDTAVPAENAVRFYLALREHKVPAEMHIYQKGPHGVGLYEGDPILSTWSLHLEDWLRTNGLFTGELFKRVPVKGEVTLDGTPISWGTMTFYPEDSHLPETTVRIRNGRFQAKEEDGPVATPSTIRFFGSIWESTQDPTDDVVVVDHAARNGVPIVVEIKEGIKPFDFKLRTPAQP